MDYGEKIRSVGTDGCASMRSTPEYAVIDAHGAQGESSVAVLHIVSLSVGDAIKVLPSWWIKVR